MSKEPSGKVSVKKLFKFVTCDTFRPNRAKTRSKYPQRVYLHNLSLQPKSQLKLEIYRLLCLKVADPTLRCQMQSRLRAKLSPTRLKSVLMLLRSAKSRQRRKQWKKRASQSRMRSLAKWLHKMKKERRLHRESVKVGQKLKIQTL